jgi:hypothetical protein
MRKFCVFVIFTFVVVGCGDSDIGPREDGGVGDEPDATDAGDLEPLRDVDGGTDSGMDADGGVGDEPEPDVDMGQSDGGDVDSGEPDGGDDADGGPTCEEGVDTDADGLSDCDEADLCTDPTNADTDGEGLSDFEELQEGTNPCKADTDNDGVNDYEEVQLGLDPNRPMTFPEKGKPDGELWRVDACENTESLGPDDQVINYYTNERANWQIGLREAFSNYTNLDLQNSVIDGPTAAAVYGDPLTTVFGFLLSDHVPSGQPSAADALSAKVVPAVLSLPVTERSEDNTGSNFETHGNQQAAQGQFEVKLSSEWTTKEVRETLLFKLASPTFTKSNVITTMPSTVGPEKRWFHIEASVIYRDNTSGKSQAVYSVAVTPRGVYDTREQVRFQVGDLVNTTAIAEVPDKPLDGCDTFKPDADIPKAEFYWVLDQSGSMGPYTATVSTFASKFASRLDGAQLDYRMGVTNMDDAVNGRLKPPGWTKNADVFANAVDTGAHADNCVPDGFWSCSTLDEYGLKNAKEGLTRFYNLPSYGGSVPPNRKIRSGAEVITIFMTDDSANSIRDGSASASDYTNFFPDHTQAFSIVKRQQDPASCGSNTAPVYEQVSTDTQGGVGSICVGPDNLTPILEAILESAVAKTSEYKLTQTPISSSLQVFINGNFIPRSSENGFVYSAAYDSISFFGDYGPEPSESESGIAEDFMVVEYDYFEDHCKESDQGADNCRDEF